MNLVILIEIYPSAYLLYRLIMCRLFSETSTLYPQHNRIFIFPFRFISSTTHHYNDNTNVGLYVIITTTIHQYTTEPRSCHSHFTTRIIIITIIMTIIPNHHHHLCVYTSLLFVNSPIQLIGITVITFQPNTFLSLHTIFFLPIQSRCIYILQCYFIL